MSGPTPPNTISADHMSASSTVSSLNSADFGASISSPQTKQGWETAASSSVLRIGIGQTNGQQQKNDQQDCTRMDKWLVRLFQRLGHWVADWRLSLVTGLLLFSAACSSSIPFTPQQDDLKSGYTPSGAPSRTELARYEQFFRPASSEEEKPGGDVQSTAGEQQWHLPAGHQPRGQQQKTEPISMLIFVQARKNGSSLLTESLLLETVQLMDKLANDFPLGGRSFAQLCTDFCQMNEPIRQFVNGFLIRHKHLLEGNRLNLTFPFMSMLGRQIDLSPHFFGAELGPDGQLASLRLILLQFRAEVPPDVDRAQLLHWERQIVAFLHSGYHGHLRPLAFTMGFVADEVVRTGMTLFSCLSVGFLIMCLFAVGTVSASAFYFRQFSCHKVLLAVLACCCPLVACASALGLLFWTGFRFGSILCVSPFLVLAIGVDDAFLMLQSWQRICADSSGTGLGRTNRQSVAERIGQMLADVGPSITITSATNVLAFCVGIFTPTPEIQLFCAGNAAAIFFDYLYQLFLFTPCLAIAGHWEMEADEQQMNRKTTENVRNNCQQLAWAKQLHVALRRKLAEFMRAYCRWIASGFTAALVLVLLLIYWTVSVHFALRVTPNLTPSKLFLADSVLNEVVRLKDAYIVPSYMPVSVFVTNAGDLRDQSRMERVKSLVDDFEKEPNNLGPAFTHFWLRDYEEYLASELMEEEEDISKNEEGSVVEGKKDPFGRSQMTAFLNWPEYRHNHGFIRFGHGGQLERFFVVTAFHGPELVEWNSRAAFLARWRTIAANYTDLGAFVWVDEAQFLDQIDILLPATVQSSIATLLCMSLVCSLFMANVNTVVLATLSIVSICVGAFGLLVAWQIDLDPISMATTIMSIGFSVDFPAHVTYHYYRCGQSLSSSPEQRVQEALVAIGFPLLQCGLSTIFFVLCLLFVDTYMSEVFVKSLSLVVGLGLLHGLFIVPSMLCAFSKLNERLGTMKMHVFDSSAATKAQRKNSISSRKIQRTGSSKMVVSVAGPG